ncbi:hypothetical protein QBC39DRAFT_75101 [Podospora conica]|nr:hypothetical protein QBC39DRAFT_75101 [Schizothecium conicum]
MGNTDSPAVALTDEDDSMNGNETIDYSNVAPKPSSEPVEAPENINGNGSILDIDDNNDNDEELSPPPDSPIDISPIDEPEPMSRGSSARANLLEDEIVVGTNAIQHLTSKPSPLRAASEAEDLEMDDVDDEALISQKRKRASTWLDPAEEEVYSPAPTDVTDGRARVVRAPKGHGSGGVKGTLLGYWRDSQAPDPKDKHAVIGFIDIRDRLRTRIQPTTRDGRSIIHEYPLPPGPGGSWVTFQQVAFDSHLVYLNQHQVKEYVKIRVESEQKDETPEQRAEAEASAVKQAIDRLNENPPPPSATEPLVAYGPEIPEGAQPQSRPEAKKRKLTTTVPSTGVAQVSHQPLDALHGTRPTRILLGYWRNSSEPITADKHAVYGILGANDMFRVKLMRETRDGRPLQGNFPLGAGALWIHWDEVEFEPHLVHLTRPEIKEYCRVRQSQIDRGERAVNRAENESLAVAEAQHRVATTLAMGPAPKREEFTSAPAPIAMKTSLQHPQLANGAANADHRRFGATTPESLDDGGPRNTRHALPHAPRGRHSLPDVELRAANRPPSALERTNSLARREIARVEAASQRAEVRSLARDPYHQQQLQQQQQQSPQPYPLAPPSMQQHQPPHHLHQQHHHHHDPSGSSNRAEFDDHVSRLNKVWAVQEASRLKVGAEDAKIYMGVKYERKQNGPFEGKLVSQGTIISIDGEDFVEYRVLTKPTFF